MAKTGLERPDTLTGKPPGKGSLRGDFRFQGRDGFARGAISLLAALKASGVKLTDLHGYDASGIIVQRGTITFEVTGTSAEVDCFRHAYKS